MKESEPQVAPVANAAGSPTHRITSSDVPREHQLAAGRFPRRGLPLCLEAQRPALGARPRLSATPGRAAALRLEKRQVGPRDRVDGPGPARFLGGMGARGLSHARRSVEGTEVPSAMNVVILGCSYRTAS